MVRFAIAIGAVLALLGSQADAAPVKPGEVNIVDGKLAQSLTGQAGDAEKGREWFMGRKLGNCLACHQNSDLKKQPYHGEVGPSLDGVGSRWDESQLRAIVVNSKKALNPETIMPAFYRNSGLNRVAEKFQGKTILTAQQIEDVVAYLKTLKEK